MKTTKNENYRKKTFLKNLGLQPIKVQGTMEEKNDIHICEEFCFYYFDDDGQVICRSCNNKFNTWFDFRLHLNILSCHTTQTNYKLNTYNDVYKKYKLKKSKTKKKMNDHLSAAQLMDLETLNTRETRKSAAKRMDLETLNTRNTKKSSAKRMDLETLNTRKTKKSACSMDLETLNTRKTKKSAAKRMDLETLNTRTTKKRCYQNTKAVVAVSKSLSGSGSKNSKRATVKTLKKDDVIYISSDESVEESNTKPNGCITYY